MNTMEELKEGLNEQFTEQFRTALGNISAQLYGAMLKECRRTIKAEGADYDSGFRDGLEAGKAKVLEHFPAWHIATKDDYMKETVFALAGEFGYRIVFRGQLLKEGWKYIPLKSLKVLPVVEEEENEFE